MTVFDRSTRTSLLALVPDPVVDARDRFADREYGHDADDPQQFVSTAPVEIMAAFEVVVGALCEFELIDVADKYRGGIDNVDPRERAVILAEARSAWVRQAFGHGDARKIARLRAIGRGEVES